MFQVSRDPDPQFCFYAGNEGGLVVCTGAIIDGITGDGSGFRTTTLGGRPALVQASTGEVVCDVVVVDDAVPGRPGLRIGATNANSCSIPCTSPSSPSPGCRPRHDHPADLPPDR